MKVFRIGSLSIIILIFAFVVLFRLWGLPEYEVNAPDLNVEITAERVINGHSMVSAICTECHFSKETNALSGRLYSEKTDLSGKIYAPNLTGDTIHGLGSWTDGEIYYCLKTGITRTGHHAQFMPVYNLLSNEDIYSIIAFLRSDSTLVAPAQIPTPKSKYSVLTVFMARMLSKPFLPIAEEHTLSPDTTDILEYGKYLACAKYFCAFCHTAADFLNPFGPKYNFDNPELNVGYMVGGKLTSKDSMIYSRNLTPDSTSGIGKWSLVDFRKALKEGELPNGDYLRSPMPLFSHISDAESYAIFTYLKSLPPVANDY